MSEKYEVVRLGVGDLSLLRDANRLFAEVFADPESYPETGPDDAWLDDLLGSRDFIALAARTGERMVGALTAYVLTKYEQARREVYIYDLAVVEDWRRCGVATALIDTLRGIAADRGAWVIFVQADHGDDPAIALYTTLGAREDVLHFDIAPANGPT